MKKIVLATLVILYLGPPVYSQTSQTYIDSGHRKQSQGDYRGAINDYTKAIELKPNFATAYNNRGLAKILMGQKDSGCLDLSKAGELGNTEAYETIRQYCN